MISRDFKEDEDGINHSHMEDLSEVQTASLRLLLDQAIAVICQQKIVFSWKLKHQYQENLEYG
jgi:hypothetical protein